MLLRRTILLGLIPLLLGCVIPNHWTPNTTGVPVLMYHHVVSTVEKETHYPDNNNVMSLRLFNEHMAYLHNHGYHTLSMEEFYCYLQGDCTIPAKSVLITIDDGYQSVVKYILPVLRRYHFNATAFVVTGRIPENIQSWSLHHVRF